MNQSVDWENKEPASDCKKASFKRKKELSHYLKIVPLMCCEQRTVSLKGPNSFYFHIVYLQEDYKQDPQQALQTEHAFLKKSEAFFPFTISSKHFCFVSLMYLQRGCSLHVVEHPRQRLDGGRQQHFVSQFCGFHSVPSATKPISKINTMQDLISYMLMSSALLNEDSRLFSSSKC